MSKGRVWLSVFGLVLAVAVMGLGIFYFNKNILIIGIGTFWLGYYCRDLLISEKEEK